MSTARMTALRRCWHPVAYAGDVGPAPRAADLVAPHEVRVEGPVLRYDYARPASKNTDDFPVYAEAGREAERRVTRYALHLPFTIVEEIGWQCEPSGRDVGRAAAGERTRERMVYFFASQPVASDRCIGYCLVARNYNPTSPTACCRSSSA